MCNCSCDYWKSVSSDDVSFHELKCVSFWLFYSDGCPLTLIIVVEEKLTFYNSLNKSWYE